MKGEKRSFSNTRWFVHLNFSNSNGSWATRRWSLASRNYFYIRRANYTIVVLYVFYAKNESSQFRLFMKFLQKDCYDEIKMKYFRNHISSYWSALDFCVDFFMFLSCYSVVAKMSLQNWIKKARTCQTWHTRFRPLYISPSVSILSGHHRTMHTYIGGASLEWLVIKNNKTYNIFIFWFKLKTERIHSHRIHVVINRKNAHL